MTDEAAIAMALTEQSSANGQNVLAFGEYSPGLSALSDSEFLGSVRWRSATDRDLVRAARDGDVRKFAKRWLKTAIPSGRGDQTPSGPSDGLLLSRQEYFSSQYHPAVVELLQYIAKGGQHRPQRPKSKKSPKAAQSVISVDQKLFGSNWTKLTAGERSPAAADLHGMLQLLSLPNISWDHEPWFRLWRTALTGVCNVLAIATSGRDGDPAIEADDELLLHGELPWQASLLFRDVKGAAKIRRAARKLIRCELEDRTDGDGTPHALLLPRLGYWLTSLIRCGQWADRFREELWDDDSSIRFNDLMQYAFRLYRPSGELALSNGFAADPQPLFQAASQLPGSDFKLSDVALLSLPGAKSSRNGKKAKPSKAYKRISNRLKWDPSSQSDWADLACLRSNWQRESDSLVAEFHENLPQIDMAVLGRSLFRGTWDLQLSLDGEAIGFEPRWEAICWNSDEDGDYLEMQHLLPDGGRVERQIWLSRTSHFAVLADSMSGLAEGTLEYTARLPLADGLSVQSDSLTRECSVKTGPVLTRIYPLFLPQDRVYSTPGGCGSYEDALVLKHAGAGGGLYVPLVLDWHPGRRRKSCQWRQLTVTEDGRILSGDAAAGFRVQVGPLHLFAYRKLRSTEHPHSVLGYQTTDETVIGDFDRDGDVSPLLLVE